jgi:glycosyltransferase involved in cell wall biosynthesis
MGVYNGAADLPRTLDSVLSQQGVDLEFVVVNDGSTDDAPGILDQRARQDPRLRVVHQPNGGLTAALVRGCELARGEFIARQDAGGDLSLPGRLRSQVALLRAQPDAILATCATRYVAPDGEWLFDEVIEQQQLDIGLRTLSIPGVTGPSHHGSCLFRRDAYERAGGYRRPFTLAQDLDLWLRMIEAGRFIAMPDVLYQAAWTFGGLTSRLRPEQIRYAEVALEAARRRRAGLPEPELPEPRRSVAIRGATSRQVELSRFHYFVGSCVARRDPALARRHFWRSLKAHPLHLRAMLRWLVPRP